jgi:hypothetical protein
MPKIPYYRYDTIEKPALAPLPSNWNPHNQPYQTHTPFFWTHKHIEFLRKLNERSGKGRTALEGVCAMCESSTNVEMHLLKKKKGP